MNGHFPLPDCRRIGIYLGKWWLDEGKCFFSMGFIYLTNMIHVPYGKLRFWMVLYHMCLTNVKKNGVLWFWISMCHDQKLDCIYWKRRWHAMLLMVWSIGSMYAIYGNIYHQYTPNVSIYTIHGSYGWWDAGYHDITNYNKTLGETNPLVEIINPSQ